ncbi:MAG: exodeoxyribonuclease V subunit gamma, partial [Solirubrobacterales bacterium]|nr:exodeoxyribonuclease V subunit gamma [Solirubrobacterales bacterium]
MIRLHRSDHADALVRALAEVLSEPPADPFAREIVAVPTRGMERWLTQQLSAHLGTSDGAGDGVCAAVEFPLPGRLLGDALAGAADIDPETDPWRSERLTWPLLQLAEELADESWMAPLARHLRAEDGQHYARIAHLASLYHRYEQERPELIETWLSGSDSRWQAELWRHLRERLGVPSPAERLGPACARLADEPELVDIGERPAFFGLTRLSIAHAQLLSALAQTREVHLMLLHPSPALWDTVAALTPARGPRRSDPSAKAANNRLLASWGRDVRELQILLGAADSRAPERAETSAHSRTPECPETPAP